MIVTRWQAPIRPQIEQIKKMFEAEGLIPSIEVLEKKSVIPEHSHPFDEVRMIAEGELILNISGNKLLLRAGDKIIIPSNTKHSKRAAELVDCKCVCASKSY